LQDLTPSDFYLFPELKEFMKGRKFADDEDVICTASGCLEDQEPQFFYNGLQALEKRWTKCIAVARDYTLKRLTKYDVNILWLTVSVYELFERPS